MNRKAILSTLIALFLITPVWAQTLDEEQIREIQGRLTKMRLLADRKQTILRSIESQGKLTEELAKRILAATTPKRLEHLYLRHKPTKLSLLTLARSRGLEQLAGEIFEAAPACADLDARAYVTGLMKDAGLEVRVDPAGNIYGCHRESKSLIGRLGAGVDEELRAKWRDNRGLDLGGPDGEPIDTININIKTEPKS